MGDFLIILSACMWILYGVYEYVRTRTERAKQRRDHADFMARRKEKQK